MKATKDMKNVAENTNAAAVVEAPKGMAFKVEDGIVVAGSVIQEVSTKYNKDSAEAYAVEVEFDFTGTSLEDLAGWAVSNRVIAWQRTIRALESEEVFAAFHKAGPRVKIVAADAGKKEKAAETPERKQAKILSAAATMTAEQKEALIRQLQESMA